MWSLETDFEIGTAGFSRSSARDPPDPTSDNIVR